MTSSGAWELGMGASTMRRVNRELITRIQHRTSSSLAAEDIAQEVWLASRGFRGESSARTFLFAVAHKKIIDWFRRRAVVRARLGIDVNIEALVDPITPLGDRVMRAESIAQLRAALEEVPEPFQGTLRLWMTGMRGEAIAETLGCSKHTVRSRVSRGKAMMAGVMGAREDD